MQQEIYDAIARALSGLDVADVVFTVEKPADLSHGDYATNAAMVVAKQLGKSPRDVAEILKEKLSPSTGLGMIDAIKIAGPGFINFLLTREAVMGEVANAAQSIFPKITSDVMGQTVMVEYTDPNPFKEFHIGHLMSNTIGESIARVLEAAGAKVIRANYQGDVGPHVAKALWGIQTLVAEDSSLEDKLGAHSFDLGKAYIFGAEAYENNEDAKKEIDEINKKIYEKSDEKLNTMYALGKEQSLAHFEEIYKVLGTHFDHYFFESETWQKGLMLVVENVTNGVFEASHGAVVYKGEKGGLHTRVFVNSAGLPTYEAKDLGLLKLKKDTAHFDLSVTVTASEQTEYFKVVLAAARGVPEVADVAAKTLHVSHGMMRFAEGKMSSRKGNVVTGESLLVDLQDTAKEKMQGRTLKDAEVVAEQVAVGAIKYAVLKQGSNKDIVFDPEKSLSLEGDSGPYLQYAHTRAVSLLKKAKSVSELENSQGTGNSAVAASPRSPAAELLVPTKADKRPPSAARDMLSRTLIHFSEVVERAANELEPHYITTYLTELASLFNSWYANEKVIGSENAESGVLLTQAFANTMYKGLSLLGISAPEEM